VAEPDVHAIVDTGKFTLVLPAGTVTLAGTKTTAGSLLDSATTAPLAGAAALRIAVPLKAAAPVTLVRSRLNDERVVAGGNVTMRPRDAVAPPMAPWIDTEIPM